MICLTNLDRLYKHLQSELVIAQEDVLSSGRVVLGKYLDRLEEQIAHKSKSRYCAVVGSGSDALMFGLQAQNVKQVIVPAQSFIATANSCTRAESEIFFQDVDKHGQLNWSSVIQDAVWVGLFGNPLKKLPATRFYEDGAQHFGLPLSGVFASYSFDPTKTLPNFGNGGAVVSNDADLIDRVKQLRRHGSVHGHTGGHSIVSERECAELIIKLKYYDDWTSHRKQLAEYYTENLKHLLKIITDPQGMVSKFVISSIHKQSIQKELLANNIQCKDVYTQPLARLPQAQENCNTFLSIPCDGYTTWTEASTVVQTIERFFEPSPFKTQL